MKRSNKKKCFFLDSGDVGTVEKSETGDFIYVPLVSKLNIKQVSCGKEHVLMLTRIGEVYSYGGGRSVLIEWNVLINSDKVAAYDLGSLLHIDMHFNSCKY